MSDDQQQGVCHMSPVPCTPQTPPNLHGAVQQAGWPRRAEDRFGDFGSASRREQDWEVP